MSIFRSALQRTSASLRAPQTTSFQICSSILSQSRFSGMRFRSFVHVASEQLKATPKIVRSSNSGVRGLKIFGGAIIIGSFLYSAGYVTSDSPAMREEPTTNVPIPTSITIASKPYELVGLGIRQVSFLKMNVYIVSLYAQLESFRKISSILNSFESLRDGDRWAHELLNSDEVELSVRIEPVRTTNGAHLRDGFTRALMNEFKKQAGTMTEEQKEETIKSLQEFKSHFPKSSVPKHTVFTFTKLSGGILRMEYEGQTLAEIKSSWLVKQFFLNYLRSDNPVSPLARESILTGFEDAAQH